MGAACRVRLRHLFVPGLAPIAPVPVIHLDLPFISHQSPPHLAQRLVVESELDLPLMLSLRNVAASHTVERMRFTVHSQILEVSQAVLHGP